MALIACSYIVPDQAGTGCVAAALVMGMDVGVSARGDSGQSGEKVPAKRDADIVSFNHVASNGIIYDFIISTALTRDWQFVHAIDQPMDLTVRRLPDGRDPRPNSRIFSNGLWRGLSSGCFLFLH